MIKNDLARLYDPVIGRFITPDTIIPEPYNPQSLNRYAYCLNNPLIYTDPTGHQDEDEYTLDEITVTAPRMDPFANFPIYIPSNADIYVDGVLQNNYSYNYPSLFSQTVTNQSSDGRLITVTDYTNTLIGSTGTGMELLNGSFRLTKKGSFLNPKYYKSNWSGGSRAGITTYSAAEYGSKIGKASLGLAVTIGAYNVYQGYTKDNNSFGRNAQVETAKTLGGIGGATVGAEVGAFIGFWLGGGVGAIPGALIGGFIGGWDGSVFFERVYSDYKN
jgi:hypothetical protein